MPDSNSAVVFSCPNCGSSIAMEGERGVCSYCGTAIERPSGTWAATNVQSSIFGTNPIPRGVYVKSSRRTGFGCAALVIALIAAVGGFALGRTLPRGGTIAPPVFVTTGPAAAPTAQAIRLDAGSVSGLAALIARDGPSDPLVYLYHSGSNNESFYTLARIDSGTQTARWQSQPLSKDAYQGVLVAGPDRIFVTDGGTLFAFKLQDGMTAWKAALDVEPQSGCEHCIRLEGDRVLVLEKNSGVEAFDTQSGQKAWSTRLENTPNQLISAGQGRLLITRKAEDQRGQKLIFLDTQTGRSTLELNPSCPRAHDSFDDEHPDWNTPFLFSADGKTMYAIYGFFAQCAQSWDLTSGKLGWQTQLEEGQAPPSWSDGKLLQGEDALYVANGKRLWALATADGKTRALLDDKEYNLTPVAARDGMLIVQAAPDWDSQRQELWGVDAQTGERHWQLKLRAHEWIGSSSSGDWDAKITPKGLVVLQVLRDQPQLLVDALNPRTGASLGHEENALTDMHMPSLRQSYWGDDMVLLEIDSDIFAVDLKTGKMAYHLE